MEPDPRAARAGVALAGALLLAGLPAPAPRADPCPRAAEVEAEEGWTRAAHCGGGAPLRGPARRLFGLPLDPNRADAPTLATLPGIGPARAAAIVRERGRRPFEAPGQLARVSGIGPRTLERLEGLLAVEAATRPEARR